MVVFQQHGHGVSTPEAFGSATAPKAISPASRSTAGRFREEDGTVCSRAEGRERFRELSTAGFSLLINSGVRETILPPWAS